MECSPSDSTAQYTSVNALFQFIVGVCRLQFYVDRFLLLDVCRLQFMHMMCSRDIFIYIPDIKDL